MVPSHSNSITEASSRLAEFVAPMIADEELALTVEGKAAARVIRLATRSGKGLGFGACKGMLTSVKEDDEHLADFKVYL